MHVYKYYQQQNSYYSPKRALPNGPSRLPSVQKSTPFICAIHVTFISMSVIMPRVSFIQVRFFYHMWGMHIISMRISIEEMEEVFPPHCDRGTPQQGQGEHLANIMTRGDGVDAWLRESRPLPKVTRQCVARIQFILYIT